MEVEGFDLGFSNSEHFTKILQIGTFLFPNTLTVERINYLIPMLQ